LKRTVEDILMNEFTCDLFGQLSIGKMTASDLTPAPEYATNLHQFLARKRVLALLLDFDGTLSPLAPRPEDAILPTHTKMILERLASRPEVFLAIISGRHVDNVREKVNLAGITYAGSHGLDIIFPDTSRYTHPIPEDLLARSRDLLARVQDQCQRDGAMVEDKGAVFTFHYRNVPLEKQGPLISQVEALIEAVGFRAGRAHAAIESKPPLTWDKGKACNLIMEKIFGSEWHSSVSPVYVGDDVTDEDAMLALKGLGFSFKVIGGDSSLSSQVVAAHQTHADVKLPDVEAVTRLLTWLEMSLDNKTQS